MLLISKLILFLGKWSEAEQCFSVSVEASKTVGDLKSAEESTLLRGTVDFFLGQAKKSFDITEKILDSARQVKK